jgi:hypothetical protein
MVMIISFKTGWGLKIVVSIGVFLNLSYVFAMGDSYGQGTALAQKLGGDKPGKPNILPGYAGTNLSQSTIKAHNLNRAATKASQDDEAAKLIASTFEEREKFVIDPENDPLIVAGNKVIADPEKVLNNTMIETKSTGKEQGKGKETTITCEEGGEEYFQKCSKHLKIVLKITPEHTIIVPHCGGHKKREFPDLHYSHWTCGGCTTRSVFVPKKVEVITEKWDDGCTSLEDLAEKGLCRYINKSTSTPNETRMIQGESITRDHFEEYLEYGCLKASSKSCAGLREKGCYQTKSSCKTRKENLCVLWEQTYRCPSTKIEGTSYCSSNKDTPYCMAGNCTDTSYEGNQDFAEVMSQMSVLKEAQTDLRNHLAIFKGQDRRCTRNCLNFRDCCGNGKGWGISLHLASCDAQEKELAELRLLNKCILVGTYCAEKAFGQCIRKKTTFCCYPSKIGKIIQEQGRKQIGLGFGSPKNPQCNGLTPEQLSKIDFSKIDFTDLFADIVAKTKPPNVTAITRSIQKSMKHKAKTISSSENNLGKKKAERLKSAKNAQIQGRSHGNF